MTGLPRRSRLLAALTALAVVAGLSACAGSPTSSPENAARAFLESMKANNFEDAAALLSVDVTRIDDTDYMPVSNVEQEAMPTGVTGFEVVDIAQPDDSRATVRATLTGGEVGEMELSLTRGGADGQQWLISRTEPVLTAISLSVPEHWTATLAGGTEVAPTSTPLRLIMFPGSDFDAGAWSDDDGYFEPVPFAAGFREDNSRTSIRSVIEAAPLVASPKLVSEAETAVATGIAGQLADLESNLAANAAVVRVVDMPTATVDRLRDEETSTIGVVVLVELSWGTLEECAYVKPAWNPFGAAELKLTTTQVNRSTHETGKRTWVRYNPYVDPSMEQDMFAFEPSEHPLSACGA